MKTTEQQILETLISEMKDKMSLKEREQFVNNLLKYRGEGFDIIEHMKEYPFMYRGVSEFINCGFDWFETPQKYYYWYEIYCRFSF